MAYDESVDAAYVYLTRIGPGEARRQHVVDGPNIAGDIILDFSAEGRLLGIEVLGDHAQLTFALEGEEHRSCPSGQGDELGFDVRARGREHRRGVEDKGGQPGF